MGTLLKPFKRDYAENLVNSISTQAAIYYVFASRPHPWTDENNPPAALESDQLAVFEPIEEMLFAKRVFANNVSFLVPRHDWSSNTIYTQYDHTDIALYDKSFFVFTDENKVFKCLFNNRGAASTVKPVLTQNTAFSTSDGYMWKYMFTVPTASMTKFGTSNSIPVVANTVVQTSAVDGIDVINIVAGGNGYLTSTNGIVQSVNSSNNQIVQIQNTARLDNDFYDGCAFYVTSGSSKGTIAVIEAYSVNSSGNWVTLSNSIAGLVPAQTTYEINPHVVITGDGTGAMAISRVSNGVISEVTVTTQGSGYTRASVALVANSSYGSGCNLQASIPPFGGHGLHPERELGCDSVGINVQFINSESNTIPTNCTFRSIGLMKNPMTLANSAVALTANAFSQVLVCNVTPSTVLSVNNYVVAHETGNRAWVVFSNTSTLVLAGDKSFGSGNAAFEVIDEYYANGTPTGVSVALNVISSRGAMTPKSPEVMYLTNISPITRQSANTETIKLTIKV